MVVAKKRIPRKIKEFSFFNIGLFNYFTAVNSNESCTMSCTEGCSNDIIIKNLYVFHCISKSVKEGCKMSKTCAAVKKFALPIVFSFVLLLTLYIRPLHSLAQQIPCPSCQTGVLHWLYDMDPEYVDQDTCKTLSCYECMECGYREVKETENAHTCDAPETVCKPFNLTDHEITVSGTCSVCGHAFETITYEKHQFEWVKDGVKSVYKCKTCGQVTKIKKAANPLSVKGKPLTVKYSRLKKKAQTLSIKKTVTFKKKGKGTLSYQLASVSKAKYKKYFRINTKTGTITLKKGLRKGTYKVKLKIRAAGDDSYKVSTKTVTCKITVT